MTTVKRGMQRFLFQCSVRGLVQIRMEFHALHQKEGPKFQEAIKLNRRRANLMQWMLNRWRGSTGIPSQEVANPS